MMKALIRKARHVLDDPVLRRWAVRRIAGLENSPPAFKVGQPPYLGTVTTGESLSEIDAGDFRSGDFLLPEAPVEISLPGRNVSVAPDNPQTLFDESYDDLETLLAAHRFAWVPIQGPAVDANWVAALWQTWVNKFAEVTTGWPWHAYTAAERAINIIDFSRRFGLPGNRPATAALLLRHAESIRGNLEYFGEHYTSNHLSNNGRGLLRIGTAIGRADYAETGAKIMIAEAGRIFGRSGVLREGSTHYHLLVTRNYIDAWLDAKAVGLEQEAMLHDVAAHALAAIPGLCLSGGIPLIGDISPDVPPGYLSRLTQCPEGDKPTDQNAWPANLPDEHGRDALSLIANVVAVSPDKLAEDGWHRCGGHGWQALAFVAPDGWPPMPGHGHQDLGSFELHDGTTKVIVDPGRGAYTDTEYESAAMHNCVTIGGIGPEPQNRAYYSPAFRERVVPARPAVQRTREGMILINAGFGQVRRNGPVEREWRFIGDSVKIIDRIGGRGSAKVVRRFCTPHFVECDADQVLIQTEAGPYRLTLGANVSVEEIRCWTAYGESSPGSLIVAEQSSPLPIEAVAVIERL